MNAVKLTPDCQEVKEELEKIIWEYMSDYQLPDDSYYI